MGGCYKKWKAQSLKAIAFQQKISLSSRQVKKRLTTTYATEPAAIIIKIVRRLSIYIGKTQRQLSAHFTLKLSNREKAHLKQSFGILYSSESLFTGRRIKWSLSNQGKVKLNELKLRCKKSPCSCETERCRQTCENLIIVFSVFTPSFLKMVRHDQECNKNSYSANDCR